mgnify:CR=1 FL=1
MMCSGSARLLRFLKGQFDPWYLPELYMYSDSGYDRIFAEKCVYNCCSFNLNPFLQLLDEVVLVAHGHCESFESCGMAS